MQGVTSQQTSQAEQQTLKWTMSFNSHYRILRAGRVKTATGGEERGYTYPVKSYRDDEYFPYNFEYTILHLLS